MLLVVMSHLCPISYLVIMMKELKNKANIYNETNNKIATEQQMLISELRKEMYIFSNSLHLNTERPLCTT